MRLRWDSVTASLGNPCLPRGSRSFNFAERLLEATPQTVGERRNCHEHFTLLVYIAAMGEIRRFSLLVALMACCTVVVGCGSGEATGESEPEAKQEPLYPWVKGPGREFLIRGGDN